MKLISNLSRGAALAVAGTLLLPAVTFAAPKTDKQSGFCKGLAARAAAAQDQTNNFEAKVKQTWATQDQTQAVQAQSVDTAVASQRAEADTKLETELAKVEAAATTDSQKQAVATYRAAVKKAVADRRAAYDAARQTFRAGVSAATQSQRQSALNKIAAYKVSSAEALASASSTCGSAGTTDASIRSNLKAALKENHQDFKAQEKTKPAGQQVKALAQARKDAFKAADDASHKAMAAAQDQLKAALTNE